MKGRLLFLGLTLAAAACGGEDPTGILPEDVLTERLESEHGVYYHAPGDHVEVDHQEEYYVWLLDRLGIEAERKLVYFKYRDRDQMREVTGADANGWAEFGTFRFHSIWPFDNHESVHALLSSLVGSAPPLMNEGVAVAHQTLPHLDVLDPVWNGEPVDSIAAGMLRSGDLPPLDVMESTLGFRDLPESVTYPVAGSFVHSVIRRHGYDDLLAFFSVSSFEDGTTALREDFAAVFQESLADAWAAWQAELGG